MLTLATVVKHLHVWLVVLSVGSFILRFIGAQTNASYLRTPLLRIAPHVIDALLLLSGATLSLLYRISPLEAGWLSVKLLLVVVYILLGTLAVRGPFPRRGRQLAGFLALVTIVGIGFLAVNKPTLM